MKRTLLLALTLTTGCISPTEPSCGPVPVNNIPATMPDGHVVWLCETEPRAYSTGFEVDHYISSTPCPVKRIQ